MKITIQNQFDNNEGSVRIQAETEMEALNPVPLLERAIEDLQWQIDNFKNCPVHRANG